MPWGHLGVGEGIRGKGVEGEAGHKLPLSLSGRPGDTRTKLPTRVTVGKLRPRAADNPSRSHSEFVAKPLSLPCPLQGSLGLEPGILPSSGPCRIRYRVVSAPPSSALVTVMQPGQRCGDGIPS